MNGCFCMGWWGNMLHILSIIGIISIPLWIKHFGVSRGRSE